LPVVEEEKYQLGQKHDMIDSKSDQQHVVSFILANTSHEGGSSLLFLFFAVSF
jgi:hypothetical protein